MSDTFNPSEVGKFGGNIKKSNTSQETTIETFSLKMSGADFRIDHKPRRKNKTPYRRALVHGFNDELTINWANDYPGGVVIKGNVKCPNTLEVAGQDVLGLINNMGLKIRALEKKVEDLSQDMQLKISVFEKKLEDLSWNTSG